MSFESEPLPEGTIVTATFETGTLIGAIRGHAGYLPVSGYMYIVEVTSKSGSMWNEYPYSCVYLPRSCLQTADKTSNQDS